MNKQIMAVLVSVIALSLVGFVSAIDLGTQCTPVKYVPACDGTDICQWSVTLPLGSLDNSGCGLTYETYWPINTDTSATCTFDGTNLEGSQLHISIDNDIISCTLNGDSIISNYLHEGCAPADPRNGYTLDITPVSGTNTIVCTVKDRGVMSHFDACVTGTVNNDVPEFSSIAAGIALIGSALGFAALRRRK
ncbi:MAG: hypothetical protein V1660_02795 [archaeon]